MKIAIIGTGNVGGALANKWANCGHEILLGVKKLDDFKGKKLLENKNTKAYLVKDAVRFSDIVLIATPAKATLDVVQSLGDTSGKIIIDAMNIVMNQGPVGFSNTSDAILANTQTNDLVKCFNTTGYNNMENTIYNDIALDMYVAGDSEIAKKAAIELAKDAGFAECYDVGGNNKFHLMEQFALFWINLAMFQGLGGEIGFKLLNR